MSVLSNVRHSAGSAAHVYDRARQVPGRIDELERRISELEATVERLDHELDEPRRLNLRAAELLDIVQSEIVAGAHDASDSTDKA